MRGKILPVLVILAVAAFAIGVVWAQASHGSRIAATGQVTTEDAIIQGVSFYAGDTTSQGTLRLYAGTSAVAANRFLTLGAVQHECAPPAVFPNGLRVTGGIYAEIAGTNAEGYVHYK